MHGCHFSSPPLPPKAATHEYIPPGLELEGEIHLIPALEEILGERQLVTTRWEGRVLTTNDHEERDRYTICDKL